MHVSSVSSCIPTHADPLVLVAEISHRVFNEYSQAIAGIRLAARSVTSIEAREILATAVARLVTFAEAHRALQAPNAGKGVDLAEHLERLCEALTAASLLELGVRLTLVADTATLAPERCWRVALVVAELITNGVRHGLNNGPGSICVEIVRNGENIVCRVIDDGCGSPHVEPGRGFAVVMGLAQELGGTIGWHFTSGGTVAELVVPIRSWSQRHEPF